MKTVTIAIDTMGGDNSPTAPILGAVKACKSNKNLRFIFVGDENKISKIISSHNSLSAISTILHTDEYVTSEEAPADAIRKKKRSSMRLCIDLVHEGKADACISAGNTGALMAMSKFVLKTIAGIDRPAIVTNFPTIKGIPVTVLDLGANASCTAQNLLDFAVMGRAYSKVLSNIDNPKVALLNIGSEELKGSDLIKSSAEVLTKIKQEINYTGYIEGDEIFNGDCNVIVTDGFTGNVTLKTIEGTTRFMKLLVGKSVRSTILTSVVGILFLLPALLKLRKVVDTKRYNGAMLIGVNGVSVKSHGSANATSFAYGIDNAYKLVEGNVVEQVKILLNKVHKDDILKELDTSSNL